MSESKSLTSRILHSMTLKEKIRMIVTILLCLVIISMMIVIRAKNNTIQTLQQEIFELTDTKPDDLSPSATTQIDVSLIVGELKSAAELSTAEISYTGVLHYEDGAFLAKKSFFMIYHADVRAGIDFKKFKPENVVITDTTVTVSLPKIEILETNIIEDKIVLIDEKKSIFNPESKEDLQMALKDAKSDLDLNLDAKALMKKATEEAKKFIEKFIRPYIGDRTLEIKFQ